jgi:hypothetical protein
MPRAAFEKKPPARLVGVAEACERLGMSRRAFDANYRGRFSDRRPAERRRHGVPVVIPEDELVVAIEDGWEALAVFRDKHGRK